MTTQIVPSITDEQLAIIESLAGAAVANPGVYEDSEEEFELMSQIRPMNIAGLIERLRCAEKDAARLEWLDKQVEAYGFEDIHEGNRWVIDGPYRDLRHAIDNAMEQSK